MYPGNYFIPKMRLIKGINPGYGNLFFNGINHGGMGLFSRINGIIKKFNWKDLINGANKTLNVINQTVPLIKEAKPMINNVRSVIQLTKAFNNETSNKSVKMEKQSVKTGNSVINNVSELNFYDNQPTFFS